MKNKLFITLLLALTALILNTIFFNKVANESFLYIGDQFFRFSHFETFINSFFVRKPENMSVLNGWQFTTQFWDVIYYLFIYLFPVTFTTAEKILFFLILLISLCFSFIGFRKLYSLVSDKQNTIAVFIVTLWYCFNPYPVMLWHGGVYNLGSSLTYSLAPLILYYFHISAFSSSKIQDKIKCALLMTIASFTFWLFAPLGFTLILYSILYLLFNIKAALKFVKNVSIILLMYIPLASFVLFNILYEYFGGSGNNNSTFMPTFGNEQGGIWYQVLLLFSWGVYTVWTPRAMYSFYEYYFPKFYIIPIILTYLIIFLGYIKYYIVSYLQNKNRKKKIQISKTPVVILLILFISLFLAKAAQPPFGEVFLYLYNNVPFFSVFRTADIRFGFSIVLCISILMLISFREFNKYVLSLILLTILGFQSIFFFNGNAITGENIKNLFYDRIVYFTKDYREVINLINKDKSISTYVLPLPAVEYGHYTFGEGEHHFGQDLLPKLINKPFTYLSLSNGMSSKAYRELEEVIKNKQYDNLRKFPIKYIILRRDITCESCANLSEKEIGDKLKRVIKNKTFTVYEVINPTPLINASNVTFQTINPVKYSMSFRNVSDPQVLQLLTSFNKDWKIYPIKHTKNGCVSSARYSNNINECIDAIKITEGEEFAYLFRKPLFGNTHKYAHDYGNQWTLDPKYIKNSFSKQFYSVNKGGSLNFDLVIYYLPQSWFYFTFLVSVISTLNLIILSIYLNKRKSLSSHGKKV